jgi:ABC-type lipoprotein release transport system permease subunit
VIGFVATLAACIIPALRVSRVPIVDALRHNA